LILSAMLWCAAAAAAEPDAGWKAAGPGHQWVFPGDHHAMPAYRSEWWYLTGVLTAEGHQAPTHGFQVTIFRLGLMPDPPSWQSDWSARDLVLGHLTVSDLAARQHLFSEVLVRAGPGRGGFPAAPDTVLAWVRAPTGSDGRWVLTRTDQGFRVRAHDDRKGLRVALDLVADGPPVFQGPEGFSVKDAEAGTGSLYYSFPRLAAAGLVAVGGDSLAVAGQVWFDREVFTSQLASRHQGWDWFGLRLDDGRSLMAFALRDTSGRRDVNHATLVEADGRTRWLSPTPSMLTPRTWWASEATGARYPVAWTLTLDDVGLAMDLEAVFPAQENVGRRSGIVYWEGMVTGQTESGVGVRGYLEMTGGGGGGALPF
jgi:predicted secreted hydrolase